MLLSGDIVALNFVMCCKRRRCAKFSHVRFTYSPQWSLWYAGRPDSSLLHLLEGCWSCPDSFSLLKCICVTIARRVWLWRTFPFNVLFLTGGGRQSKAWTVFAHLHAEIVVSNSTRGMDVCIRLFCVCVLRVGSGLTAGWFPVQGVLPTVYRINKLKKWPRTVEPYR
jgi:hypothetical protein